MTPKRYIPYKSLLILMELFSFHLPMDYKHIIFHMLIPETKKNR